MNFSRLYTIINPAFTVYFYLCIYLAYSCLDRDGAFMSYQILRFSPEENELTQEAVLINASASCYEGDWPSYSPYPRFYRTFLCKGWKRRVCD